MYRFPVQLIARVILEAHNVVCSSSQHQIRFSARNCGGFPVRKNAAPIHMLCSRVVYLPYVGETPVCFMGLTSLKRHSDVASLTALPPRLFSHSLLKQCTGKAACCFIVADFLSGIGTTTTGLGWRSRLALSSCGSSRQRPPSRRCCTESRHSATKFLPVRRTRFAARSVGRSAKRSTRSSRIA